MTEPYLLFEQAFIFDAQFLYDALVSAIEWDTRIQARKTASFGKSYSYSGMTYPDTEIPFQIASVVDSLEARLGFRPNNCLLNYYGNGKSTMGFHADSTGELMAGTGVAIVSLGGERSITFRSKTDKANRHHYRLTNGSLLYMTVELQQEWQHAVLPQADADGRISLTFRAIAD